MLETESPHGLYWRFNRYIQLQEEYIKDEQRQASIIPHLSGDIFNTELEQ